MINNLFEIDYKLKLNTAMPETLKLIQLVLTIPVTLVSCKISMST